jgi:hypothetical protein
LFALLALGGFAASTKLAIGDLDPGAPELARLALQPDTAYVTGHYALSSDQFAVIVKTERDGCLKYETLVEADRLGWDAAAGARRAGHGLARRLRAPDHRGIVRRQPQVADHQPQPGRAQLRGQQTSVNNPDLFNPECSVMPVIAYLSDHKAETLERVVAATQAFAAQHDDKDRTFLLARAPPASRLRPTSSCARPGTRCSSTSTRP